MERVRVEKAARLENLLLALAIVVMILAVIGQRGKKLGYADKYSTRKKKQEVISWMKIAVSLLRESTKYFNLLFKNKDGGFYFR